MEGEPEPPVFEDWEELFSDGVQAFVIGFVYLLVPAIVAGITVGGAILSALTGTGEGLAAAFASLAIGFLISSLLSIVFGYFAVAAVVNFASEESLGAAFDFGTIRRIAFDRGFAIAWGLSLVVFIGASIVVGVLNVVPLLGTIVGAFVFFYAQIVAAHLWAGGYNAAMGAGDGTGVTGIDESAA